jgi:DNA polymerase-3 subunit delta'
LSLRPLGRDLMSLKEIFCQDSAISILQRAYASDKSPHAYIFAGAEGIGRFKTACEWARLLLCNSPVTEDGFSDSCGSCQSCRMFDAGSHPDFHHIYKELREFTKEGKTKAPPLDLPIDVVREFLIDKASARPTLSQRTAFVVSEGEKLNNESQNCMLKVLEEPPQYCTIILLCTRMEKLLPTTKSRCHIIRFLPIAEEKIIDRLKQMGLDTKEAQYFARLAQGRLGQACQWARLELADAGLYQTKKELLSSVAGLEYSDTLELAEWVLNQSKEIAAAWAELDKSTSKKDINRRAAKTLVQVIISALHDAMTVNLSGPPDLINFDQKEQIKKLTQRLGVEGSAGKIAGAYQTMRWIESAVNERLIFEQLLLNLAVSDKIKV